MVDGAFLIYDTAPTIRALQAGIDLLTLEAPQCARMLAMMPVETAISRKSPLSLRTQL